MFEIKWLPTAAEQYNDLKNKAFSSLENRKKNKNSKASKVEGLFKQIHKCINQLSQNPRHPGLQTHEYSSLQHPYLSNEKVFEAYAQNQTPGAYPVFWCYGPDKKQITIIAITPHP